MPEAVHTHALLRCSIAVTDAVLSDVRNRAMPASPRCQCSVRLQAVEWQGTGRRRPDCLCAPGWMQRCSAAPRYAFDILDDIGCAKSGAHLCNPHVFCFATIDCSGILNGAGHTCQTGAPRTQVGPDPRGNFTAAQCWTDEHTNQALPSFQDSGACPMVPLAG